MRGGGGGAFIPIVLYLLWLSALEAEDDVDDEGRQEVEHRHGDLVEQLARAVGDMGVPHHVLRR